MPVQCTVTGTGTAAARAAVKGGRNIKIGWRYCCGEPVGVHKYKSVC